MNKYICSKCLNAGHLRDYPLIGTPDNLICLHCYTKEVSGHKIYGRTFVYDRQLRYYAKEVFNIKDIEKAVNIARGVENG